MKLEIRYPTGSTHTVEYSGTLVSIGRDPSCDLVLSDAKCSRRHAVIEAGPSGLAIRDTGSANGVFLNGRRVERGFLQQGDLLRLGEVILKVLAEDEAGTMVVEDVESLPPPPPRPHASLTTTEIAELPGGLAPRAGPPPQAKAPSAGPRGTPAPATPPGAPPATPPRDEPASRPGTPRASPPGQAGAAAAERRGPIPRPLTVSVLAVLWSLAALAFLVGGLVAAASLRGTGLAAWLAMIGGVLFAAGAAVLAFGLWRRSPWARPLQIVVAGLGVLTCAFLPAALTTLLYMLRAEARGAFSGMKDLRDLPPAEAEALQSGSAEAVFTLSILATVALAVLLSAGLAWAWLAGRGASVP